MKPPINVRLALCVFALFAGVAIGIYFLPVPIEYRMAAGAVLSTLTTVPSRGPSLLYELAWKLDRKWHRRSRKIEHMRTGWYDHRLCAVWCYGDTFLIPFDAADPDAYVKREMENGVDGLTIPASNDTPEKRLAFFLNANAVSPNDVTPPMRPVIVVRRVGVLSGLPVKEVDILVNGKHPHRRVAVSNAAYHTS